MTYSVEISGHIVTVQLGETILEAALSQGVPYPHGCRSGNCGACKSRLLSGEVEMSPWSEFALSPEEKESGLVLPAARFRGVMSALNGWMSGKPFSIHFGKWSAVRPISPT